MKGDPTRRSGFFSGLSRESSGWAAVVNSWATCGHTRACTGVMSGEGSSSEEAISHCQPLPRCKTLNLLWLGAGERMLEASERGTCAEPRLCLPLAWPPSCHGYDPLRSPPPQCPASLHRGRIPDPLWSCPALRVGQDTVQSYRHSPQSHAS